MVAQPGQDAPLLQPFAQRPPACRLERDERTLRRVRGRNSSGVGTRARLTPRAHGRPRARDGPPPGSAKPWPASPAARRRAAHAGALGVQPTRDIDRRVRHASGRTEHGRQPLATDRGATPPERAPIGRRQPVAAQATRAARPVPRLGQGIAAPPSAASAPRRTATRSAAARSEASSTVSAVSAAAWLTVSAAAGQRARSAGSTECRR